MWLLQRIADTCMSSGKDLLSLSCEFRPIQLQIHQLVHILPDKHIAVELNDSVILRQREWRQFRPAVVESRIVGVVHFDLWKDVFDTLRRDAASFERSMSGLGEGVCV